MLVRQTALVVLLIAAIFPSGAGANCRIHKATGKCISVPSSQVSQPDFSVGDIFPVYEHNMVMEINRFGLKPVDGAWRYYRSGSDIYRVSSQTFEVLEIIRNARIR